MQTIYIDISIKGVVPTIYSKQGDIGRKFEVIFTNSGLPYTIPADSVFSVWYSGESGEGNYTNIGDNSAFYVNENKVTVELITQMLTNDGNGILCIVLNESNGNQIGSWNIPYLCEKVPGIESEAAKEYYTAFSKSVEGLKQITENLTPEAIGAHPDTWLPTIEEIGAAPAGYVDERGQYTDYTSALAQIKSVYASMGDRTKRCLFIDILNLDSTNFPTGSYFVEIYREWENYGTIVFTSSAYIKIVIRIAGSWGDFCYENPPMNVGVEYRTTERWQGKVVYTTMVNFGNMPNNSTASVSITNLKATGILSCHGVTNKGDSIPYSWSGEYMTEVSATVNNIYLYTRVNASDSIAYITLKYTKG